MKKTLLLAQSVLIALILCSSCASIVSKSSYPLAITTKPVGANISIVDKSGKEIYKGVSPTSVTLKSGMGYFKKAEYLVKLSSPGYPEKVIPVNFKINGWYFGNLLLGGLLGMLVIDPLTGAMWKIENTAITEDLGRTISTVEQPVLQIVDIHTIPEQFKNKLVRVR